VEAKSLLEGKRISKGHEVTLYGSQRPSPQWLSRWESKKTASGKERKPGPSRREGRGDKTEQQKKKKKEERRRRREKRI